MQHLLFRKNCYKRAVNCCLVWSDVMILLGLGVLTLSISLMPYPTSPPLCSPLLLALDIQLAHLVVKLCLFCCVFFPPFLHVVKPHRSFSYSFLQPIFPVSGSCFQLHMPADNRDAGGLRWDCTEPCNKPITSGRVVQVLH